MSARITRERVCVYMCMCVFHDCVSVADLLWWSSESADSELECLLERGRSLERERDRCLRLRRAGLRLRSLRLLLMTTQ